MLDLQSLKNQNESKFVIVEIPLFMHLQKPCPLEEVHFSLELLVVGLALCESSTFLKLFFGDFYIFYENFHSSERSYPG